MPKSSKIPTRLYGKVSEVNLLDDLKKVEKPKKCSVYQIDVAWSDGDVRRVFRTYDQLQEFSQSITSIAKELGIPKIPAKRPFERTGSETYAIKRFPEVKQFVDCVVLLPPYIQQSDGFLWFWEPSTEDQRLGSENSDPRGLPGGTDYICVCTALSSFDGVVPEAALPGLPIRSGDVIYVLRMQDCPNGFWLVRNVFGSEGYVPLHSLRVEEGASRRLPRSGSKTSLMKSSEHLAADKRRQSSRLDLLRSAENLSDRRRSRGGGLGAGMVGGLASPPMSRTLRDLNTSIRNYMEPPPGAAPRRRSGRHQIQHHLSQSYIHDDRQVTQDLIQSLHETSLMLQERMVITEQHQPARHRLLYDEPPVSRPRHFVRSPSKRGVRVSARFRRMTPSPAKSPCRKGIRGLRPAAPSPLAAPGPLASPSQNMTFEKSPGVKRSTEEGEGSPTKRPREESGAADSGVFSGTAEPEPAAKVKPRRRSDIARRVSLRLKQVYCRSPVRSRTRIARKGGREEGKTAAVVTDQDPATPVACRQD